MKNDNIKVQEMVGLIKEASQLEILPRWGKVIGERKKGSKMAFKDTVTEADLKSSEYILKRILAKFPGSYSEEHKNPERFSHSVLWQLDPLDGTQEFCEGFKEGYSSMAALLEKHDKTWFPIAGIIYTPANDKLCYCSSGEVTLLYGENKIEVPKPLRSEIRGYVRRVDPSKNLIKFYKQLGDKLNLKVKIMKRGGIGASIIDLIENKINLLIFNYNHTKEWDIAMAIPIIKSLGGFICDLEGNDFTEFNNPDSPGFNEPYLLKGFIVSIAFKKEEIFPIPSNLLQDKLIKS